MKTTFYTMRFVYFFLFLFTSISIFGQQNHPHINKCEYENWLEAYENEHPGYTESILEGLKEFKKKKLSEKRSNALITIPVHVILVHAPGQSEGSGTNFTVAHVQSQIDVINQDFGYYNSDAGNTPPEFSAGDTGIQFCLATVDPDGNSTDGITRYGTTTSMANSDGRTEVINATRWPREQYMNIWSAPNLPFLGLASVPSSSNLPSPSQDFILVASSTFGGPGFGSNAPYDLGRTTTHEVGHWLGLFHVWGGGCGSDDGIDDTPNQSGSNFGCPNHPSPSCGNNGDMFMNYMDYVNDACMYAFSLGQGAYMNTILNSSRASLLGSSFTACSFVVPLSIAVLDQKDPNCFDSNDGYILVEAGGGSPGYSYSINGGEITNDGLFTDLPGGSHTIEVFDADGVTSSVTVFLNTPLELDGEAEITAANDCANDAMAEVTIEVSGGTNPYFYSLNMGSNQQTNTFDELANGFYVYQVTDNNGCVLEGTFEIAGADDLEITVDQTQGLSCNGDTNASISVMATGGSGPLSYTIADQDDQEDGIFENLGGGDYLVFVTDSVGCYDSIAVTIDEPESVIVSGTTTDVVCNGSEDGQIEISASGGNGMPFSYVVNDQMQDTSIITSLAGGEYVLMAIDSSGCVGVDTVIVSEPAAVVVESIVLDVSCYNQANGEVDLNVSGGTGGYQYIMNGDTSSSNVTTGLSEGSFMITVIDENNCASEVLFDIGYSQTIGVSTSIEDITCLGQSDGTIELNTSNTEGNVLYSLNGAAPQSAANYTNLPAGDYQIIISDDSGCDGVANVTLEEPSELLVETNITENVSCFGGNDGQVEIISTGGSGPYTYEFDIENTDPDELMAGTYNLSVTDLNGCIAVSQFSIVEPTALILDHETNGADVVVIGNGGIEPYTYSFNGGSYTDDNTYPASSDVITASILDANGCISTIQILNSDVDDISSEWSIKAYPIPSIDILFLDMDFNKTTNVSIEIFDLNGKLIHNISSKKYQSGENSVKIDVSNFASSIYIVKIASAEGYRYIKVTKT